MKRRTKFVLGLTAAALSSLGVADAQVYSLATNPQGSVFYSTGAAISRLMVEKTGLQFRVAPYAGSTAYVPLINRGEIAFGLVSAGEAAFAYAGTEIFKGHANANLREVLVPFANDSGFAVRTSSPIRRIADLKGRRVPVGYIAGRIFHYLAGAVLATAGLTERDLDGTPVAGFVGGIHAFAEGRVDAAYITLNAAAGREAMATIPGGWRYLSIGNGPGVAAAVNRILPSRPHALHPGRNAVGVVDDPTVLLQVDFNIIAAASVPDDVVYRLARTMYENKPALVAILGAFHGFDPRHMAQPHPTPYHPGAIRFYKEIGLWPPT